MPCMHTCDACVRGAYACARAFLPLRFFLLFFSFPSFFPAPFHPQARDPPREGTFFLTGGGPQRRRFFYFTPPLSHSTPSTVFPPLSLSLFFSSRLFFPLFFSFFYRCTHYPPFRFRIGVLFIHRRPEWPLAPRFFT